MEKEVWFSDRNSRGQQEFVVSQLHISVLLHLVAMPLSKLLWPCIPSSYYSFIFCLCSPGCPGLRKAVFDVLS